MTIYLYFPKLTNPKSFTKKQRSTIAGMRYCKGRFGERTYEKENDNWYFKLNKNPISSMIMREVVSAKEHLMEIQMDYDKATGIFVLWGYRYPDEGDKATKYEGLSFEQICWEYLWDLKKKYCRELVIE